MSGVVLPLLACLALLGLVWAWRRYARAAAEVEDAQLLRFGEVCRGIGLRPRTRQPKILPGKVLRFAGRPTSFGRTVRGRATVGVRLARSGPREDVDVTQVWAGPVPIDVEVQPPGPVPAVDRLLGRPDVPTGDEALDPLARIAGDPARVSASLDRPTRQALHALRSLPGARVSEGWVLVELPGHDVPRATLDGVVGVAQAAARELRRTGALAVPEGLYRVATEDDEPAVRAKAATALAELRYGQRGEEWEEQLEALAAESDPGVAIPAAVARGDLDRLLAVGGEAHTAQVVEAIADALGGAGSVPLVRALEAAGPDAWTAWVLRRFARAGSATAEAARLLGKYGGAGLLPELAALADDAALPPSVRRAARAAAAGIRVQLDPTEAGRIALAADPAGQVALADEAGQVALAPALPAEALPAAAAARRERA